MCAASSRSNRGRCSSAIGEGRTSTPRARSPRRSGRPLRCGRRRPRPRLRRRARRRQPRRRQPRRRQPRRHQPRRHQPGRRQPRARQLCRRDARPRRRRPLRCARARRRLRTPASPPATPRRRRGRPNSRRSAPGFSAGAESRCFRSAVSARPQPPRPAAPAPPPAARPPRTRIRRPRPRTCRRTRPRSSRPRGCGSRSHRCCRRTCRGPGPSRVADGKAVLELLVVVDEPHLRRVVQAALVEHQVLRGRLRGVPHVEPREPVVHLVVVVGLVPEREDVVVARR